MKQIILVSCAAFLFGAMSLANANFTFDLAATIDGAQANAGAGTGSTATGSATMTYDNQSGLFSWNISWTPLLGTITVAHFHGPAVAGANAGVQVPISGLTSPSTGSAFITPVQASDLLAGLWYINIHSDLNPVTMGGEIRGQVELLPCNVGPDADGDCIVDENDNCTTVANMRQIDTDADGYGNACDMDLDQSRRVIAADLRFMVCAFFATSPTHPAYNPEADCNSDGRINFLDLGGGTPTVCMVRDFFLAPGPSCVDSDPDLIGDLCSTDWDGDGITNAVGVPHVRDNLDNCTLIANSDQLDTDGDFFGNVCDADLNNDCVVDDEDANVMQLSFNSTQGDPDWNPDADLNGDLVINIADLNILGSQITGRPGPSARPLAACTGSVQANCGPPHSLTDIDNDTVANAVDDCTFEADPLQRDSNANGIGNFCDPDLNDDCFVDQDDIDIMNSLFGTNDADADLNGDGVVGFMDLALLNRLFLRSPGPSELPNCVNDFDDDDMLNVVDNCTLVANPDQLDTNGDGFGNVCDPDLNNDCVVNDEDADILQLALFSTPGDPNWNPDADFNGDLLIDLFDLTILSSYVPGEPGPSGQANCVGVP